MNDAERFHAATDPIPARMNKLTTTIMHWVAAGMLAWAAWETWGLTGCLWIGGGALFVEACCRTIVSKAAKP